LRAVLNALASDPLEERPTLTPRPAACDTPAAVKGWRPDPAQPDVAGLIRRAGLRPTQQRLSLGKLLFGAGDRHVTAEMLHAEAIRARMPVSLATVYNTLRQFTEAGLLRELTVDGARAYFDTNLGDHHHFFVEGEEVLSDVPAGALNLQALPDPPEGMEIVRVDVVVRLRRKRRR
jgi:Fur family iron response transcriptional regulator